ncbi:MAG: hypothetical protein QOJ68_759, partial [Blastococcus sp.]|nr:hypothetical protein [Blastococcus sp.]
DHTAMAATWGSVLKNRDDLELVRGHEAAGEGRA